MASEINYLWKLDTSPRETGATFIFTGTRSLPHGGGVREKSGGPRVAVAVGHIPPGKAPVRESIISPSHLNLQMASGSMWLKWSNVGSDETMWFGTNKKTRSALGYGASSVPKLWWSVN